MKIAYVSYEVTPFAKVGGLADVAGALPKYIKNLGTDVYLIMPLHKVINKELYNIKFLKGDFNTENHKEKSPFNVYQSVLPETNVKIYFIDNKKIFSSKEIYEANDLSLQSSYFCDAAIKLIKELEADTEIIHVNDWQTSLIPVYLKTNYNGDEKFANVSTVITIHNLGYQGVFSPEKIDDTGLPNYIFNVDALEFYGNVNYLKGGILFSDIINTVSKTYAEEIQTDEYGAGMDGVLRIRSDSLYGILNGIDYDIYDPKKISYGYNSLNDYTDKIKNKISLQKELGLPIKPEVPVVSFISRLVDQKGIDIVVEILDYLMMYDIQMVFLGKGEKKYEKLLKEKMKEYPDKISANILFDNDLAQKIYIGSDIFLMPSKYEPCGLGQMYAMRYGTVPVVRYTGGLADTVMEYYPGVNKGTGFGFYNYESCELFTALSKALFYFFKKKSDWIKIFENCMLQNFSYKNCADQYNKLYKLTKNMKKRW